MSHTYSVLKVTKLKVAVCIIETKKTMMMVLANHFQKIAFNGVGKFFKNLILSNQLINEKELIRRTTQGKLTIGVPVDKKIGVAIIKPMSGVVSKIIGNRFFDICPKLISRCFCVFSK
jgi:hypothetical protein